MERIFSSEGKFFPLRLTTFQRGLGVQESKLEEIEVVSFTEMASKLTYFHSLFIQQKPNLRGKNIICVPYYSSLKEIELQLFQVLSISCIPLPHQIHFTHIAGSVSYYTACVIFHMSRIFTSLSRAS